MLLWMPLLVQQRSNASPTLLLPVWLGPLARTLSPVVTMATSSAHQQVARRLAHPHHRASSWS